MNRNLKRLNPKMFDKLPSVLLSKILASLHLVDLYSIFLTNKKLSLISTNEYFWQVKSKHEYNEIPKKGTWLEFYKLRSKFALPTQTLGSRLNATNGDYGEMCKIDRNGIKRFTIEKDDISSEGQYMGKILFRIDTLYSTRIQLYERYPDLDCVDNYFCQWFNDPSIRHLFRFKSTTIDIAIAPISTIKYNFSSMEDLQIFISKFKDSSISHVANMGKYWCYLKTLIDPNALYPRSVYQVILQLYSKKDDIYAYGQVIIDDLLKLNDLL